MKAGDIDPRGKRENCYTISDKARAIGGGVLEAIKKIEADMPQISLFIHGTTAGLNTIAQRKGAKVGLITTEGFSDILEMTRSSRKEVYNYLWKKPEPLVPRYLRLGVKERTSFKGEILERPDEEEAKKIVEKFKEDEVEAIAVCLLHSYANPATFLYILKDLLGETVFKKALHVYMDRWQGKHPTPYDFFFSFNDGSRQNLNWLFHPWFFEYGYVDLAIESISGQPGNYTIVVKKDGLYPAPIRLRISFDDHSEEIVQHTAKVWKEGNNTFTFNLNTSKIIKKAELFDPIISDAVPGDNLYLIR